MGPPSPHCPDGTAVTYGKIVYVASGATSPQTQHDLQTGRQLGRWKVEAAASQKFVTSAPGAEFSDPVDRYYRTRSIAELDRTIQLLWDPAHAPRLVRHRGLPVYLRQDQAGGSAGEPGAVRVTADGTEAGPADTPVGLVLLPPDWAADRRALHRAIDATTRGAPSADAWQDVLSEGGASPARAGSPVGSARTSLVMAVVLMLRGALPGLDLDALRRQVTPMPVSRLAAELGTGPTEAAPATDLLVEWMTAGPRPRTGVLLFSGTGLDLAFHSALVTDEAGTVLRVRDEGAGTRVTPLAPARVAELARSGHARAPSEDSLVPDGGFTVLMVGPAGARWSIRPAAPIVTGHLGLIPGSTYPPPGIYVSPGSGEEEALRREWAGAVAYALGGMRLRYERTSADHYQVDDVGHGKTFTVRHMLAEEPTGRPGARWYAEGTGFVVELGRRVPQELFERRRFLRRTAVRHVTALVETGRRGGAIPASEANLLRPGGDPTRRPTPDDWSMARELVELARQRDEVADGLAGDSLDEEIMALVDHLGLRADMPGAAARSKRAAVEGFEAALRVYGAVDGLPTHLHEAWNRVRIRRGGTRELMLAPLRDQDGSLLATVLLAVATSAVVADWLPTTEEAARGLLGLRDGEPADPGRLAETFDLRLVVFDSAAADRQVLATYGKAGLPDVFVEQRGFGPDAVFRLLRPMTRAAGQPLAPRLLADPDIEVGILEPNPPSTAHGVPFAALRAVHALIDAGVVLAGPDEIRASRWSVRDAEPALTGTLDDLLSVPGLRRVTARLFHRAGLVLVPQTPSIVADGVDLVLTAGHRGEHPPVAVGRYGVVYQGWAELTPSVRVAAADGEPRVVHRGAPVWLEVRLAPGMSSPVAVPSPVRYHVDPTSVAELLRAGRARLGWFNPTVIERMELNGQLARHRAMADLLAGAGSAAGDVSLVEAWLASAVQLRGSFLAVVRVALLVGSDLIDDAAELLLDVPAAVELRLAGSLPALVGYSQLPEASLANRLRVDPARLAAFGGLIANLADTGEVSLERLAARLKLDTEYDVRWLIDTAWDLALTEADVAALTGSDNVAALVGLMQTLPPTWLPSVVQTARLAHLIRTNPNAAARDRFWLRDGQALRTLAMELAVKPERLAGIAGLIAALAKDTADLTKIARAVRAEFLGDDQAAVESVETGWPMSVVGQIGLPIGMFTLLKDSVYVMLALFRFVGTVAFQEVVSVVAAAATGMEAVQTRTPSADDRQTVRDRFNVDGDIANRLLTAPWEDPARVLKVELPPLELGPELATRLASKALEIGRPVHEVARTLIEAREAADVAPAVLMRVADKLDRTDPQHLEPLWPFLAGLDPDDADTIEDVAKQIRRTVLESAPFGDPGMVFAWTFWLLWQHSRSLNGQRIDPVMLIGILTEPPGLVPMAVDPEFQRALISDAADAMDAAMATMSEPTSGDPLTSAHRNNLRNFGGALLDAALVGVTIAAERPLGALTRDPQEERTDLVEWSSDDHAVLAWVMKELKERATRLGLANPASDYRMKEFKMSHARDALREAIAKVPVQPDELWTRHRFQPERAARLALVSYLETIVDAALFALPRNHVFQALLTDAIGLYRAAINLATSRLADGMNHAELVESLIARTVAGTEVGRAIAAAPRTAVTARRAAVIFAPDRLLKKLRIEPNTLRQDLLTRTWLVHDDVFLLAAAAGVDPSAMYKLVLKIDRVPTEVLPEPDASKEARDRARWLLKAALLLEVDPALLEWLPSQWPWHDNYQGLASHQVSVKILKGRLRTESDASKAGSVAEYLAAVTDQGYEPVKRHSSGARLPPAAQPLLLGPRLFGIAPRDGINAGSDLVSQWETRVAGLLVDKLRLDKHALSRLAAQLKVSRTWVRNYSVGFGSVPVGIPAKAEQIKLPDPGVLFAFLALAQVLVEVLDTIDPIEIGQQPGWLSRLAQREPGESRFAPAVRLYRELLEAEGGKYLAVLQNWPGARPVHPILTDWAHGLQEETDDVPELKKPLDVSGSDIRDLAAVSAALKIDPSVAAIAIRMAPPGEKSDLVPPPQSASVPGAYWPAYQGGRLAALRSWLDKLWTAHLDQEDIAWLWSRDDREILLHELTGMEPHWGFVQYLQWRIDDGSWRIVRALGRLASAYPDRFLELLPQVVEPVRPADLRTELQTTNIRPDSLPVRGLRILLPATGRRDKLLHPRSVQRFNGKAYYVIVPADLDNWYRVVDRIGDLIPSLAADWTYRVVLQLSLDPDRGPRTILRFMQLYYATATLLAGIGLLPAEPAPVNLARYGFRDLPELFQRNTDEASVFDAGGRAFSFEKTTTGHAPASIFLRMERFRPSDVPQRWPRLVQIQAAAMVLSDLYLKAAYPGAALARELRTWTFRPADVDRRRTWFESAMVSAEDLARPLFDLITDPVTKAQLGLLRHLSTGSGTTQVLPMAMGPVLVQEPSGSAEAPAVPEVDDDPLGLWGGPANGRSVGIGFKFELPERVTPHPYTAVERGSRLRLIHRDLAAASVPEAWIPTKLAGGGPSPRWRVRTGDLAAIERPWRRLGRLLGVLRRYGAVPVEGSLWVEVTASAEVSLARMPSLERSILGRLLVDYSSGRLPARPSASRDELLLRFGNLSLSPRMPLADLQVPVRTVMGAVSKPIVVADSRPRQPVLTTRVVNGRHLYEAPDEQSEAVLRAWAPRDADRRQLTERFIRNGPLPEDDQVGLPIGLAAAEAEVARTTIMSMPQRVSWLRTEHPAFAVHTVAAMTGRHLDRSPEAFDRTVVSVPAGAVPAWLATDAAYLNGFSHRLRWALHSAPPGNAVRVLADRGAIAAALWDMLADHALSVRLVSERFTAVGWGAPAGLVSAPEPLPAWSDPDPELEVASVLAGEPDLDLLWDTVDWLGDLDPKHHLLASVHAAIAERYSARTAAPAAGSVTAAGPDPGPFWAALRSGARRSESASAEVLASEDTLRAHVARRIDEDPDRVPALSTGETYRRIVELLPYGVVLALVTRLVRPVEASDRGPTVAWGRARVRQRERLAILLAEQPAVRDLAVAVLLREADRLRGRRPEWDVLLEELVDTGQWPTPQRLLKLAVLDPRLAAGRLAREGWKAAARALRFNLVLHEFGFAVHLNRQQAADGRLTLIRDGVDQFRPQPEAKPAAAGAVAVAPPSNRHRLPALPSGVRQVLPEIHGCLLAFGLAADDPDSEGYRRAHQVAQPARASLTPRVMIMSAPGARAAGRRLSKVREPDWAARAALASVEQFSLRRDGVAPVIVVYEESDALRSDLDTSSLMVFRQVGKGLVDKEWQLYRGGEAVGEPNKELTKAMFARATMMNRPKPEHILPEPLAELAFADSIGSMLDVLERSRDELQAPEQLRKLGEVSGFTDPRFVERSLDTLLTAPPDWPAKQLLPAAYVLLTERRGDASAEGTQATPRVLPLGTATAEVSGPIGVRSLEAFLRAVATGEPRDRQSAYSFLLEIMLRPDGPKPAEIAALVQAGAHVPAVRASALLVLEIILAIEYPTLRRDDQSELWLWSKLTEMAEEAARDTFEDRSHWSAVREDALFTRIQDQVRSEYRPMLGESVRLSIDCPRA